MSHTAWLASRTPEAPADLVECVRALFTAHPEWNALHRADAFIAASEQLLRRVLGHDCPARSSALDLLAADACVTYAFEAAADEPGTIAARAELAMRRIAAIAAEYEPGPSNLIPGVR